MPQVRGDLDHPRQEAGEVPPVRGAALMAPRRRKAPTRKKDVTREVWYQIERARALLTIYDMITPDEATRIVKRRVAMFGKPEGW